MKQSIAYGSRPIRGQEWTADPNEDLPYKRKPKYNTTKKACNAFYDQLTRKDRYTQILGALTEGLSIEDLTKMVLLSKITSGEVNILQFPVLVEPFMIILWYVARQAGVNPIIYDKQNSDLTEDEIKTYMKGGK